MSTALFYASSTGHTEDVANKIVESLGNDIKLFNIANDGYDAIKEYDKVILGISTWGEGDLQDDWEEIWSDFCEIDFSGKTVALFGLGDQESYADEFVDALGTIYEQVSSSGANVIGFTSTDGYEHDASRAEVDGKFVGLVIDEDNQEELTQERVKEWTNDIKISIL